MFTAGRMVFAFGLASFGAVGLFYGEFVNSLQPIPSQIPGYDALALLNSFFLIAVGLLIAVDREVRPVGVALAVLLGSWIVLLHIPSAFANPALLRSPWWIRTFETVALIGGALTLAGLRGHPVHESWIRTGRLLFGLAMPVFGTLHLIYPQGTASLVPPWYPWPLFWARFTGVAQIAGGLALASGFAPRVAAFLAGAMYGLWALTLHIPRIWCRLWGPCEFLDAPRGLENARPGLTSLFVAFAMCGAAWLVCGGAVWERRSHTGERPP